MALPMNSIDIFFLTRWLASNILETDRHMAMVVQAIQSGLSLESAKRQAREKMNGTIMVLIDIILSTYANHVTNTLHLMKEIAERRQAEITRLQKEKYQRALLDTFPYAVWLKNTESNFISVNEGFARIY
jgi:PAS domain-containing protein